MLAMNYGFTLDNDFDMTGIRRRVIEKGPIFEQVPGLVWKVFLCQDRSHGAPRNEYGAFYVWQTVEAAHDFLTGPLFDVVIDSFGRPDVRLWVPLALDLSRPPTPGALASRQIDRLASPLYAGEAAKGSRDRLDADKEREGYIAGVAGLDPTRWEVVRFSLWHQAGHFPQDETMEIYEVLHVAAPQVPEADLAKAS